MDEFLAWINTLAHESVGGGNSFQTVAGQRVKGVALFLENGQVAFYSTAAVSAQEGGGKA